MRVNLGESFYGLGGLFHSVGHDISVIQEEIEDEEEPDFERIKVYIEAIVDNLKAVKIGNKYVPNGLLTEYARSIKSVEEVASYKNIEIIRNFDYRRQEAHLTILEFAQEEKNSDWDDMMNKVVEEIIDDRYGKI